MTKYTGTYICPHCEEKFSWKYTDYGFRRGRGMQISEVFEIERDPSVSACSIGYSDVSGDKVLKCYCAHCQMPVEIEDTGDIPTELF